MACVYVYVIILTFIGPEYKGRSMAAHNDRDLAEATKGGTTDDVEKVAQHGRTGSSDDEQVHKA
jgi:SHS family lactate transporter-like MFS transporter